MFKLPSGSEHITSSNIVYMSASVSAPAPCPRSCSSSTSKRGSVRPRSRRRRRPCAAPCRGRAPRPWPHPPHGPCRAAAVCCLRDGLVNNEKLLSRNAALYHPPPRPAPSRPGPHTSHRRSVSSLCSSPPAPPQVITKIRPMCDVAGPLPLCAALLAPSLSHFTVR